jgi:hypothetical protein
MDLKKISRKKSANQKKSCDFCQMFVISKKTIPYARVWILKSLRKSLPGSLAYGFLFFVISISGLCKFLRFLQILLIFARWLWLDSIEQLDKISLVREMGG